MFPNVAQSLLPQVMETLHTFYESWLYALNIQHRHGFLFLKHFESESTGENYEQPEQHPKMGMSETKTVSLDLENLWNQNMKHLKSAGNSAQGWLEVAHSGSVSGVSVVDASRLRWRTGERRNWSWDAQVVGLALRKFSRNPL